MRAGARGHPPGVLPARRVGRLRGLPRSASTSRLGARAVLLRGPRRQARRATAKPTYIFQLLFYNRAGRAHPGPCSRGGCTSILGDGERPPFRPEEFDAYAARVRRALPGAPRRAGRRARRPAIPTRSSDCDFCPWWKRCADRRRDEDHLSLVATAPAHAGAQARGRGRALGRRRSPRSPAGHAGRHASPPRRSTGCASRPTCRSAAAASRRPAHVLHEPEHGRGLAPPAAAVGRRCVLRLRGRPVLGRRGPRVPVRHRLPRGRRVALLAAVGHDPRRGEGALRGVDGLDHRAPGAPPRPARLSLQLLRADRDQAAHVARTPRASTRSTSCCAATSSSTSTASCARRCASAPSPTGSRRSSRCYGFKRDASLRRRSARCAAGQAYLETGTARCSTRSPPTTTTTAARRSRCATGCWSAAPRPSAQFGIELDAARARAPSRRARQRAGYLDRLEAAARAADGRPPRRRVARRRRAARAPAAVRSARLPPPRGQARLVGVLRAARA